MSRRRVLLVTGGSGGIGAALCRDLAAAGYALAVHGHRNAARARALADELRAAGAEAQAFSADLRTATAVRRLFDDVEQHFGGVDALVANAGVIHDGPLVDLDEEVIEDVLGLNLFGTLYCLSEAARRLPDGGHIVALSSVLTRSPPARLGLYAASKAAVEALVRSLAQELGPRGIRVNAVLPGPVSPGLFDRRPDEDRQRFAAKSPLGRLGRPEDISAVVRWLLSGGADWLTGQLLTADGGAWG